jgi:hypothetical protein
VVRIDEDSGIRGQDSGGKEEVIKSVIAQI